MQFTYIGTQVTGINRTATAGESEGSCLPTDLVWGFDTDFYTAVGGVLTPKDASELEVIAAERTKLANKARAEAELEQTLVVIEKNNLRKANNLPPSLDASSEAALQDHVLALQADVDFPSEDAAYNPPLPPGVTPPAIQSLTVTITREPGWQGNLGFRVVLGAADPNYTPTNLALAVYSGANCTGYLYTTGAFQYDSENDQYFAVCPPGQEPGDNTVHMGLLYGAAQLSCFTLEAGVQEKKIYAYEEV